MWEFAIGLILLQLHPDSLILVAVFGLMDSGAQFIAGPYIGSYVDRYAALLLLSLKCVDMDALWLLHVMANPPSSGVCTFLQCA